MSRSYKEGSNRCQGDLFPRQLDEYVSETNPVRLIDAYVETLDLKKLGYKYTKANVSNAGQPPYSPADLLKLYIYGFINQITTSRRLERETHRNLEVIWLLKSLHPSYKTIADFRKDNSKSLRETHKEFILLCKKFNLISAKRISVDGSFFKGNVSQESFKSREAIEVDLTQIEREIALWEASFDEQEYSGLLEDDPNLEEKISTVNKLARKEEQLNKAIEEQNKSGKKSISITDSEARLLRKPGKTCRGYNVQIATDSLNHLIVADDVTNDTNDAGQLHPICKQAKDILGAEELEVLSDSGYYSAAQINRCIEDKITPYVPIPEYYSRGISASEFKYDAELDFYFCPTGKLLKACGKPRHLGTQLIQRYLAAQSDCSVCPVRNDCITEKSKRREIWRSEYAEVVEQHRQRMKDYPDIMKQRSAAVEHPFGTLKRRAGSEHFNVRGKEKVLGEWSLMALCYNLTRVINILGFDKLMEALKELIIVFSNHLSWGLESAFERMEISSYQN